jgi:ribonuclease E
MAQSAPDIKALDELVDLSDAVARHSERLAGESSGSQDGDAGAKKPARARTGAKSSARGSTRGGKTAKAATAGAASGAGPDDSGPSARNESGPASADAADQSDRTAATATTAKAARGTRSRAKAGASMTATDRAPAAKAASGASESGRTEPGQAEPGKSEPGQAEPGKSRSRQAERGTPETSKSEPGQPETGQAGRGTARRGTPERGRSESSQADSGAPESKTAKLAATRSGSRQRAASKTTAGQPPEPVGGEGRLPMTALLFQAPVLASAPGRRRAAEAVEGAFDTTAPDGSSADRDASDGARSGSRTKSGQGRTADSRSGPARGGEGRANESRANGSKAGEAKTDESGSRSARKRGGAKAGSDQAKAASGTQGAASGKSAEQGKADAPDELVSHDLVAEPEDGDDGGSRRRRRRTRPARKGEAAAAEASGVTAVSGSTRLEAKRQRRKEGRETGRRRTQITEAEFLARREAVERRMVVRERDGRTQIAVLEDGVLVEHYVARRTQHTMVGNVYLGRVQNVLPSMEAAFVDIGRGRNAVLYAGEVNWDAVGLEGQPRRIEQALNSGDSVMVQVTKDPIGHKGSRLTSQITLAGRYLVFVPDGSMTGISRKLPEGERQRLKKLLKEIVPEGSGVIVRTAAEGASDAELKADVERLAASWQKIQKKAATAHAPALLKGEPDLAIRVVRDIFNADFTSLTVSGEQAWSDISGYLDEVAPELRDRAQRWTSDQDVFAADRIDEQLAKGMDRKVWLPSGGSLVIDRTEAMSVIDVNTGKFTGAGGTLEETVTRNNLEAAEEIVRQLRLRDIGGIIVIDFIDMVLESNRDLVLRRLVEALARDRTRHQVAEVTSLGLVQMTRKRVGQGLVEAFSETCEACGGRGFIVHADPVERGGSGGSGGKSGSGGGKGAGGDSGNGGDGGGGKRKKRGGKKHRKNRSDAVGAEPANGGSNSGGGRAVLAATSPEAKATLASIAAAAVAAARDDE